MDGEVIYSIFGVIAILVIGYKVLGSSSKPKAKTKLQKRAEIIEQYKKSLAESLEEFSDDKEGRMKQKSSLLQGYSTELSQNIFFDNDEIREIILELSVS